MEKKSKSVAESYDIDEYLLMSLAQDEKKGTFFSSSYAFYKSVKEKNYKDISAKQKKWLGKIETSLQERAKRSLRKNLEGRKVRKFFTLFPKKIHSGWVWGTYYDYEENK